MPHAAHFICASHCRFFLATKIGKYIVSTVGEYVPDSGVRKIFNETRKLGITSIGDQEERDFINKNGFEEIGFGRTYETMVFGASKAKDYNACCPWRIESGTNIDMNGYTSSSDAYAGHMKMCAKYARK